MMVIEFDGLRVEVKNPDIQNRIKGYLMRKSRKLGNPLPAQRTHITWTPEQDKTLIEMYQGGQLKQILPQQLITVC